MKPFVKALVFASAFAAGVAIAATPQGWSLNGSAPKDFDVGTQPGTRVPGSHELYLRAKTPSTGFATITQTLDATQYRGKRVRYAGYLRTQDAGKAILWLRMDDAAHHPIVLDNMDDRAAHGDSAWTRYELVQDVPDDARSLSYGVLLSNQGQVLASGLSLDVVGKDVPTTSNVYALPTAPVNLDFAH